MPLTYEFDERQTGTFTGVIRDGDNNPIGYNDLQTLILTLSDQNTGTIINDRDAQNILNANDVTVDVNGNLSWDIQAEDNIIVSDRSAPGTVERHEVVFAWTWGSSKSSNETYYFDVTQIDQIDSVGQVTYGTILGGDTYFTTRLNSTAWTSASDADKTAALTEATWLMNQLNYKGEKTSSTQFLEFPRGGDTTIPTNIANACYELAWKLLEGADPDYEMEALRNSGESYEGIRESYHRGAIPEWIASGIISARAWLLLKPYLRDPRVLKITRES